MIAGIVLDDWKLPIFKRHLDAAGFVYTQHPGLTPDTLILKVSFEDQNKLTPIVRAANAECFVRGSAPGNA